MQADKVLAHLDQILSFLSTHIKLLYLCEVYCTAVVFPLSLINKHCACYEIAVKLCLTRSCTHVYGSLLTAIYIVSMHETCRGLHINCRLTRSWPMTRWGRKRPRIGRSKAKPRPRRTRTSSMRKMHKRSMHWSMTSMCAPRRRTKFTRMWIQVLCLRRQPEYSSAYLEYLTNDEPWLIGHQYCRVRWSFYFWELHCNSHILRAPHCGLLPSSLWSLCTETVLPAISNHLLCARLHDTCSKE